MRIGKEYNIDTTAETPHISLKILISELSKINNIVILIDEYDYPILSHLQYLPVAREIRDILRSFYTVLKSMSKHIRFTFLTGVSKFSRTSLFSGLNNLFDISNSIDYAALLGYTHDELEFYFQDYITRIAQEHNKPETAILSDMRTWYNGYRFSEEKILVYNPHSVLLYLTSGINKNYWFETGTPRFLVDELRHKYKTLENIMLGSHC